MSKPEALVGVLDLSQWLTQGASSVCDKGYMTQEIEQVLPESTWDGNDIFRPRRTICSSGHWQDPLVKTQTSRGAGSRAHEKTAQSLVLHEIPNTVPLDCDGYRGAGGTSTWRPWEQVDGNPSPSLFAPKIPCPPKTHPALIRGLLRVSPPPDLPRQISSRGQMLSQDQKSNHIEFLGRAITQAPFSLKC